MTDNYTNVIITSIGAVNAIPKINIPLYWINLDRSEDRRNKFLTEVVPHFTYSKRIDAVDAQQYNTYKIECPHYITKSPAQIACIFSHLYAMYQALCDFESGIITSEYVLIMEDDMNISPILNNQIDLKRLKMPANDSWDILQLYVSHTLALHHFRTQHTAGDFPLWIPWIEPYYSAGAYIIKYKSLKILLDKYLRRHVSQLYSPINSLELILSNFKHCPLYCVSDYLIFIDLKTITCTVPLFNLNVMPSTIDSSTYQQSHDETLLFTYELYQKVLFNNQNNYDCVPIAI